MVRKQLLVLVFLIGITGAIFVRPYAFHGIAIFKLQKQGWDYRSEIVDSNNFISHRGAIDDSDLNALWYMQWAPSITLYGREFGDDDLKRICDLSNIQATTKDIRLLNTSIRSLSPLSSLSLEYVEIYACEQLADISPLLQMKSLKSADLIGNSKISMPESMQNEHIRIRPKPEGAPENWP